MDDMRNLVTSFPLLVMTFGAIGATFGLYLYTNSNFNDVLKKGVGLFLTIIMTYVCFSGAAYAMTEAMLKKPEVYFKALEEDPVDQSIKNVFINNY